MSPALWGLLSFAFVAIVLVVVFAVVAAARRKPKE